LTIKNNRLISEHNTKQEYYEEKIDELEKRLAKCALHEKIKNLKDTKLAKLLQDNKLQLDSIPVL
jgi:hypothetical protein